MLNDWINSNYAHKPWTETFVGIERTGGDKKGTHVCYVVRTPMGPNRSRAFRKCKTRAEAIKVFLAEVPGWVGEIPYRDTGYHKKPKTK